ncbi:MAG: ABC transporter permease, partial [Crocinitomicaceae bacterium]|nr:ABC transporter permease [Crocinitomicaceae bacterium]
MRFVTSTLAENIRIAFNAIRSQALRATLTVSIITIGIMALVGMITAIQAIKNKLSSEFSRLGTNTFTLRSGSSMGHGGQRGVVEKRNKTISYEEAAAFKRDFPLKALISVSAFATGAAVVKYGDKKTNPNISVLGADENYLELSAYHLNRGRGFSPAEIENANNVVVLGADIVRLLFS